MRVILSILVLFLALGDNPSNAEKYDSLTTAPNRNNSETCMQSMGQKSSSVRIAVLYNLTNEYAHASASLVVTKLSQNPLVSILERNEIDTVLQEHELSLSSVQDKQGQLQVSKLLHPDLMVVLNTVDNSPEAGLLILNCNKGLRLIEQTLDLSQVEKAVSIIVDCIDVAIRKNDLHSDCPYVCINSIRNVDLGGRIGDLTFSIGNMLKSRLVKSKNLILLERDNLNMLLEEERISVLSAPKFLSR